MQTKARTKARRNIGTYMEDKTDLSCGSKRQLGGQSPEAHGVRCHVSCDMARYGNAVGHRFFQQEENILFRLRAEACDSRWLVFVFVSGTVVALIESCELSRFEIP